MADVLELVVAESDGGERVDRVVAAAVSARGSEMSVRQAKLLVDGGAVTHNGRRARKASERVAPGDRLRVVLPPVPERDEGSALADLGPAIIYRDDYVLAVNKPSGLPTHATHDPERDHAQAAVQRLLGPQAYVAVHHRLDVETSGVLIFATDRRANKGLAEAFAERRAQKTYVALVAHSALPDRFVVENHLGRDRHDRRRMAAVHAGGDLARTEFEVRCRSSRGGVVQARPHTGRMHQIRVHLAGLGAPIIGDVLYGGEVAARLMLHAESLVLRHPITGELLQLGAPVPEAMAQQARARGLEV